MEIRFIGGLWRRLGNGIKSYTTYAEAVEGNISYEETKFATTDDILDQLQINQPSKRR
jgi:hypothetical protein